MTKYSIYDDSQVVYYISPLWIPVCLKIVPQKQNTQYADLVYIICLTIASSYQGQNTQ